MKRIDEYIREHNDDFNMEEPPAGHFDRFEAKLKKKSEKRIGWRYLARAAVITLLVALSSLYVYEHFFKTSNQHETDVMATLPVEFREASYYFTNLIDQKMKDINNFSSLQNEEKLILFKELEAMDSVYNSIKNELKVYPGDERILNALIQYYKVKINVLDRILTQLESIENINKNRSYEKDEI